VIKYFCISFKNRYLEERRERNRELGIPEPLESVTLPDAEQFQLQEIEQNRGRRGRDQPRFQRGDRGIYFFQISLIIDITRLLKL
jgi:hypothetical protein